MWRQGRGWNWYCYLDFLTLNLNFWEWFSNINRNVSKTQKYKWARLKLNLNTCAISNTNIKYLQTSSITILCSFSFYTEPFSFSLLRSLLPPTTEITGFLRIESLLFEFIQLGFTQMHINSSSLSESNWIWVQEKECHRREEQKT